MKRKIYFIVIGLVSLALFACTKSYDKAYQFEFTFEKDEEGWVTGFADLPADYSEESYQLDAGWGALPSGLDGNAIYLQGHNRSDDLFMFLAKQIDGLKPNTNYRVIFSIDLASNTD